MAAKRCSRCGLDWPTAREYVRCPECQERTDPILEGKPMPAEEAKSRAAHAKFERLYEKREQERIRRGDPSPEEIERADRTAQVGDLEALWKATG